MRDLKPFKKGERIVFIGDSITELTYWISAIADYYAQERPQEKIEIYPCGIAGGSCLSALTYYHEQTAIWSPTTAVIMLGMNDIWRDNYGEDTNDFKEKMKIAALKNYETNLAALSEMLQTVSRVQRIIYLAPTPYDEEQHCDEQNLIGCQSALRKCAKIMKKTAEHFGGEFYDFGEDIFKLIHKLHEIRSKNELIQCDRVHPNDLGFSVMARQLLYAQGFTEMKPTVEMIESGKARLELSSQAKEFNKYAFHLQRRWTIEWIFARQSPDQTELGRKQFLDNYVKNNPDCGEMIAEWVNSYKEHFDNEEENKKGLRKAVENLYKR